MLSVSALHIYPLKSARGVSVDTMTLDERGAVGDRRWMLIDDDGTWISLRTVPRLAFVQARPAVDGISISVAGGPAVDVPVPQNGDGARAIGHVYDGPVPVLVVESEAAGVLSDFLGVHCRLAYQPDDAILALPRRNAGTITAPRRLALTDGAALLLIGEGSLTDLNGRLKTPVPMSRFRPNIVVSGGGPFAEDAWRQVSIGDVRFEFARACPRCVATTVDQATGEAGVEPLRTLSRYRRNADGVAFGQNIVHLGTGQLRVGDAVTIHA